MEIHKSTSHFSYRIEEKPGGGFIASSAELLQKIQAKASAIVGEDLSSDLFKASGSVKRTFNINISRSTPNSLTDDASLRKALQKAEHSFSSPLGPSSGASGTVLRILAGLIALAAVVYLLLHR